MNKATFQYLCNELRGHVQRTNLVREAISVEKRIAITLCPWGSPILAGCPLGRQVQASKPLGMMAEGYPWAPNDWTISAIICCTEDINCHFLPHALRFAVQSLIAFFQFQLLFPPLRLISQHFCNHTVSCFFCLL